MPMPKIQPQATRHDLVALAIVKDRSQIDCYGHYIKVGSQELNLSSGSV
jgi:hypothetical protein